MIFKVVYSEYSVKKIEKTNSLIVALYLFQFGILLPLFSILGNFIVVIFTVFLVVYAILKNGFLRFRFNMRILGLILLPLSLLLLKLPFEPFSLDIAIELIRSFLTIGISAIIVGSLPFSKSYFLNYAEKIGYFNLFSVGVLLLTPFYNNEEGPVNYMKFGYALLPSVIFSFYSLQKKIRLNGTLFVFLFSFILMAIFGARGAMFNFVLFVILFFLVKGDLKIKMILLLLAINFLLFFNDILYLITGILEKFEIHSYSMDKYLMFFQGGSVERILSGRGEIFREGINRLWNSPILGEPLNTAFFDTGFSYYHNVFLDVGVNFGIVFLIGFMFFIFSCLFILFTSKDTDSKSIFLILMVLALGRILVSSSFWQRPEFWLFLAYFLNYKRNQKIG